MAQLPNDVRSAVRFFAFMLANGTLALDIADDIDLREALIEPSWVEMAFTIFVNVLDVDPDGSVSNEALAKRRAAQYLRACLDNPYVVEPPFAEWEIDLPM